MSDHEGSAVMETHEVLTYLGISRTRLYELMRAGAIAPLPRPPYLKRARKLQFRRADVESVKRTGTANPPAAS